MGSAMASMPHYMSQGVNEMAAHGVEKAVNGLMEMTMLSVTGVEEIVVFVVDMMTSTYACLITLAVSGSLHAVINTVESAQKDLQSATQSLGKDVAGVVNTFEDAYNAFQSALKGISFGTVKAPSLDLSQQMTTLSNLKLPDRLFSDLESLNKSIPTFAQVQNFTNNVIRLPFEEVKGLINNSLGTYNFDRSVFPVPQKEQLTFCSDNHGINKFFDDLVDLAALARKVFIGVLLAAAILACVAMAYREVKRWQTMKGRSQLVSSSAHDPMDVVYIVSRPYTATAGLKLANNFHHTRRQILVRWVIAYATSEAALFVLALAVAGLFSCACQAIMLKTFEKEVPNLTNQVGAFADKVVAQLNNASEQWAIGTNAVIGATNRDINHNMLGWVNITSGALNDTLNTFVNETMKVLNQTFGGTVLYDPIVEVLNCLVLMKVTGIEKALTWISDHAHIDFPRLPNDTFSLGAVASIASGNSTPGDSFLAGPGTQASDDISAAVSRFVDKLQATIRTEALISTVVLLVWVAIVLIGIIRALTLWFGHDKMRGEGGTRDFRPNDFRADNQDRFQSVPLETVNIPRPATPAPQYTRTVETKEIATGSEDEYQNQKFGFAGQRNDASLSRNRFVSSHGEIYGNDKR